MSYIIQLDHTYPDLAKAECEALGAKLIPLDDKYYASSQLPNAKKAGFTSAVYEVLAEASVFEDLAFEKEWFAPNYKLHVVDFTQNKKELTVYADHIHSKIAALVDLKNPEQKIYLFISKNKYILTKKIFARKSFATRHTKELPGKHPTTMDPKLARAMINLAQADSIYDPFCGAGGIVIEAQTIDVQASGSDIVPAMINRAQANAQHLDVEVHFSVADATTLEKDEEAYVTDLPYGRNSAVSEEIDNLYEKFFLQAQKNTTTIVCGSSKDLHPSGWEKIAQFKLYVHKSLTRYISVFKLSNGQS
jgi:putative methyltransferase (TIGR01177 family)